MALAISGSMSKLLDKPFKAFAAYALLILACSIPAYYWMVDSIWLEELDEHNQIVKEQTQRGFNGLAPDELGHGIALLNQVQPAGRIWLVNAAAAFKDSVYTTQRSATHNGEKEIDRFRGLSTTLVIHGKPYRIVIETNVEEADETVVAISAITCVFIALLIIGFALLNRSLSKRIWRPFYNTLEKLRGFDLSSDNTLAFAQTDIREFEELNRTLSKFIANNIQVYAQQKEFTQNASHELQTPLAVLKTRLDLFIQDTALTGSQREVIASLNSSVSRITRINKNLLLLAKIENHDYAAQELEIGSVVASVLDSFNPGGGLPNSGLIIKTGKSILVTANESLVEILAGNLLSNAIRHSPAGRDITVQLEEGALLVSNPGGQPLRRERLFRRFGSASPEAPGSGLGLAIVKEICDKYGWQAAYDFKDGAHIFSITF